MNTTNGSKAYGMISYAKYIFPPLPVMIEKLIFDRAYTGLHVVTNNVNTISDVFRPRDRHLINFDFYAGAVTIVAYNTGFCEIVNSKLQVCSWTCGITY